MPEKRKAGRPPGARNKVTQAIRESLEPLAAKGRTIIDLALDGKYPCRVCHGRGRTAYQPAHGKPQHERKCESCYGEGYDRINPLEVLKMAMQLQEYVHAKQKAVELTGQAGGPLQAHMTIEFVRPLLGPPD